MPAVSAPILFGGVFPAQADVLLSVVYGDLATNMVGTYVDPAVYPATSNVIVGVTYGPNNNLVGTLTPTIATCTP